MSCQVQNAKLHFSAQPNAVVVHHPQDRTDHNLTICVRPMYNQGDTSVGKLVEFVEFHRLLGADHFAFYLFSEEGKENSPLFLRYLNHYRDTGLVDAHDWSLRKGELRWNRGFHTGRAASDFLTLASKL